MKSNPKSDTEKPIPQEIRLQKPPRPVMTDEVREWVRYWASKGGAAGKGKPERKEIARRAANIRWGSLKP